MRKIISISFLSIVFVFISINNAYSQRRVRVAEPVINDIQEENHKVLKRKVAIGRFSNETQYAKGLFYDKENDPMGKQALDILSAKLAESGKFLLLERNDLSSLLEECKKGEKTLSQIGADYIIIGSVTEFGRKNIGKQGILSRTKTQTVEATVAIRLVDVSTGLIIYSGEGKGEADLTTKTVLGIGGRADYDATLSDKAISEAIGQMVENIINKCTDKPWKTYFLSSDEDGSIIAGGESQGIEIGEVFVITTKGKQVKNPQTGLVLELPGKEIGTATVVSMGGETPESEYSIVSLSSDMKIDQDKLNNYVVKQLKNN